MKITSGTADFVPPALASLNINPINCRLAAEKRDDCTVLTYTLSWEVDESPSQDLDVLNVRPEGIELTTRESVYDKRSKPLQVNPINLEEQRAPCGSRTCYKERTKCNLVLCDGPCEGRYAPHDLTVLGRCGHFLCKICSGIIVNTDGSDGCSAFHCAYNTVYQFLPEEFARHSYEQNVKSAVLAKAKALKARECGEKREQRDEQMRPTVKNSKTSTGLSSSRRSRSAETSAATGNSRNSVMSMGRVFSDQTLVTGVENPVPAEAELLNVRLMIFAKRYDGKTQRFHESAEFPATVRLKDAIHIMFDQKRLGNNHSCPSHIYFCEGAKGTKSRRVTSKEYEKATLVDFPSHIGTLHFVLDCALHMSSK